MILCISVLSVVISPFSFLILLIWFFSRCFLMSLANGLSTLFILSKNQLLALLIFAMVSFVSFAFIYALSSVQFSHSVVSNSHDPMNFSMPGLPASHQLPEFTQTHVHRVSVAIQPSHPLSSPFPPAPNPSQHWSLFQWVNSSHEGAKVLEFQL